jgi:hypothetical protein
MQAPDTVPALPPVNATVTPPPAQTPRETTPESSVTQHRDMQQWIAEIVKKLTVYEDVSDLTNLLTGMLDTREEVENTMQYITSRSGHVNLILSTLKAIPKTQKNTDPADAKLTATGSTQAGIYMLFFVCGFLKYDKRNWMSFQDLVKQHPDYVNDFYDYMIRNLHATKTVVQFRKATEYKEMELGDETKEETGPCFICAEPLHFESMMKLHPTQIDKKHVLILDAFTTDNQYLQYHPVVWYLYCLWIFTDGYVHCYGVKTARASYIFLGNWSYYVETTWRNPNTVHGVLDLVLAPFEMYRRDMRQLQIGTPAAVISILSPVQHTERYIPLLWAHLLLHPTATTMYADDVFGQELQDMLAFAIGKTKQQIFDGLSYTPQEQTPIVYSPFAEPSASKTAYALLAKSHYDLMTAHRFLIPVHAKPEEILFDAIEEGNQSQHLDHIDALCPVRYNWVFESLHTDISKIRVLQQGLYDTYHNIDVHRHITHLLSTPGTENDLLKPLHTGSRVAEILPGTRTGVIVFDQQEAGRINGYFRGHDPNVHPNFHATFVFPDTTNDCLGTLNQFVHKTPWVAIPADHAIDQAMRDYFQPTHDLFSLCDMAFKYVVRSDDGAYFMQDSFELQELDSNITKHTFDACHRCPVCLELKQTVEATDQSMYNHLVTRHHDYPLADLSSPSPEIDTLTSDLELAETEQALHQHSSSSDSTPPSTLTSADMSRRSHTAEPGESHELMQQIQSIQSILTLLKLNAPVRPKIEAGAQAAFSQENYDNLQQHCNELQQYIDQHEQNVQDKVDRLTRALDKMDQSLLKHDTEKKQLEDHMKTLNEDHRTKTEAMNEEHRKQMQEQSQQHEKILQEQLQPYIQNDKVLRDQLAGLQQMLQAAHADQNLAQQLLDANAEIERLRHMLAHPSSHSPAPDKKKKV